ncbi:hypothetical protein Rhopal_003813-T1 [Rhodotorula paludigena]|uniref:Transcription initiation factor TFIID subunit 13 n=1 Tax=Rhodotorula paludigena TaxID=86838 RepID=A0AAV5GNG7_9BASI|nr:hypothetical protein Rhopal_003813-T1 [Rhodotorula paludigena]
MSAAQPQARAPAQRKLAKKGLFAKDLAPMMYGFGDDNPAPDSIAVMEELVIEHITDICTQAHRISTTRGKIKVDDFRFALRRDPKKLARLDELLFMQEEIARARRGFEDSFDAYADEDDIAAAKADAAAGVGTLSGPTGPGGAPGLGVGAGAGAAKKPAAAGAGGLQLSGGGAGGAGADGSKPKASKAKGKQKAT